MIEQSPEERMETILNESWELLKARVVNGDVDVGDEADMQFHLGTIMDKVGHLYCLNESEGFAVRFEYDEAVEENTNKVDLVCILESGDRDIKAAIELKRKKEGHPANKGSLAVYQDLANLEYLKNNGYDKAKFFMFTDWKHYLSEPQQDSARSVFRIYDGAEYRAGEKLSHHTLEDNMRRDVIELNNDYHFDWDDRDGFYFLKLDI